MSSAMKSVSIFVVADLLLPLSSLSRLLPVLILTEKLFNISSKTNCYVHINVLYIGT